jgi:hypothetical protein
MEKVKDLIDINKKKGFPRVYRFNQFVRWFTLTLGLAAMFYAFWMIFDKIGPESKTFYKIVPFIILFLVLNSVMRNLFSLNSILFTETEITFRFLARKSVIIPWNSIKKMVLSKSKRKHIIIHYLKEEKEKIFEMTLVFPNMLEIINSIAELCPDVEYDQFMKNVIISKEDKVETK